MITTVRRWFHMNNNCPCWQDPRRPRGSWQLRFFWFLETAVIVACLRLLSSQVVGLFWAPLSSFDVIDLAFRFYISFFSIAIILVELELPAGCLRPHRGAYTNNNNNNTKTILFPLNFGSRGILYSFVGLAAYTEGDSAEILDLHYHHHLSNEERFAYVPWMALLIEFSALPLMILGFVYMLLGVCCLQPVRDRLEQQYQDHVKEYQEIILAEYQELLLAEAEEEEQDERKNNNERTARNDKVADAKAENP